GPLQSAHRDGTQTVALLDGLALLSQPQHAVHRPRRGRSDEGVDSTAAACEATAASMEHNVSLAGGRQNLRELSLRLIDGEARGAGPTLLVAVGISDEHALAPAVRLEVSAIQRIGHQLAHRLAAALERLEGLELRSDVQSDLPG